MSRHVQSVGNGQTPLRSPPTWQDRQLTARDVHRDDATTVLSLLDVSEEKSLALSNVVQLDTLGLPGFALLT